MGPKLLATVRYGLTPAAQLWGFAKVVALERPEMSGGVIDLGALDEDEMEELVGGCCFLPTPNGN